MNHETRWIIVVGMLGFLTAYLLWGHPRPAEDGSVASTSPVATSVMTPKRVVPPLVPPVALKPAKPHGETALKFVPDSIDFGVVPVNESREADMRLENPTDTNIVIRDLAGSCGCLQLKSDSKEIPAHGSLVVHCHFSAFPGRKSDLVRGQFTSNELHNPFISFDVHGKVKEEFQLEWNPVSFDVQKKSVSKSKEVTLRSDDGLPFKITMITGSRTEFTYAWEPVDGKNGSAYTIRVAFKSEKGGSISDSAAIITDRRTNGTVALNVSGLIEQDLNAVPSILISDMDASRVVAPFSTVVRHTTPGRLEILGVADGSKNPMPLDFAVDRIGDETCRVSIKFKEPYPTRAPYGYIQIKTNVEESPLNVPYRVNMKPVTGPPPSQNVKP